MKSPQVNSHRNTTSRRFGALAVAVAVAAASLVGVGTPAAAEPAAILGAGEPGAVPGYYLVVLKDSVVLRDSGVLTRDGQVPRGALSVPARRAAAEAVDRTARALADRYGATVGHRYSAALRGFTVRASEAAARRIATDASVAFVEQNRRVRLNDASTPATTLGTQPNPPSWGLDRVDQRNLPLDNSFSYPSSGGQGVHAYVIDSGIRFTHQDFGGRVVNGIDVVDGGTADDCYGHGSHVAGTLAGTTYGVAKNVTLVAVRVWACDATGDIATTTQAIDWVTANAQRPAVTNMSFGWPTSFSSGAFEAATNGLIDSGVTVVASAGNDAGDACAKTPAFIPAALTVGNTWSDDGAAWLSNHGPCVDLFAPGQNIVSAGYANDTAVAVKSGTSMAAPHVAGAAALILAANPTWTPAQVHAQVLGNATSGVVFNTRPNTTSRLLYVPSS
ncbi:S8 family peptidase [Micromonospora sp. KC606]|uniref:S8 family peptidase n=1 Tax=Micromonospora sp. KC606 TaxID=2530379 RepID=UPI00104CC829|nr:S8 family peptidase [Micromonospora sp. KC606]TDC85031.1 S8 family peptidase [Micromonospora sp. KC606]